MHTVKNFMHHLLDTDIAKVTRSGAVQVADLTRKTGETIEAELTKQEKLAIESWKYCQDIHWKYM